MLCTAPPGARLGEFPHKCLDCRRKIPRRDRIAFYKSAKKDANKSDSEDNDTYVEFQESLIKSIVEVEALIAEYATHHCKNKKLLKSSMSDLTNKS
jgi:hypothetical protein